MFDRQLLERVSDNPGIFAFADFIVAETGERRFPDYK